MSSFIIFKIYYPVSTRNHFITFTETPSEQMTHLEGYVCNPYELFYDNSLCNLLCDHIGTEILEGNSMLEMAEVKDVESVNPHARSQAILKIRCKSK